MKKNIIKISVCIVLFFGAFITGKINTTVSLCLYLSAYLTVGTEPIISAFKGIFKGSFFGEDTLMVVSSMGALCMKEYSEAVAVMLFYGIGEIFENYAVNRSRNSITELINIQPTYANLIKDGKVERVDVNIPIIDDIIVVSAGEKVPLDGVIIEGTAFFDTSMLTGEAVPRKLSVGDEIFSGCINTNSTVKITVKKTFENSTACKIVELIEESAIKKSKSEKFITKFAKYYTPAVLVCAGLLIIVPLILGLIIPSMNIVLKNQIYKALEFLVVSCPCALVISVPITFFGGIGFCAKNGILVKGSNYLETVSTVKNAVFDKTGTLTKGVFNVTEINPENCDKDTLLRYCAYAENQSTHPIAKAIISAYGENIDFSQIEKSEEIAGYGVVAVIAGETVIAGNYKMMQKYGIGCDNINFGTVVYVAVDGRYKGSIIISDEIKQEASVLTDRLKKNGIEHTFMLTGDNGKTAGEIKNKLEIDTVYSDLLPTDKVNILEKIMSDKEKTLYVGDGINDAPVIARADVGIAMGALGSDAAIEAADIVIMNDDISKVADVMKIGVKTKKIARQNIVFALAVKILILLLCAVGFANMWLAVFGDVGVLVICVLNSLRTLKMKG